MKSSKSFIKCTRGLKTYCTEKGSDLSSDYLNQLGADVLELVLKLDGLGDGDSVLRDLGAAPALLDDHVATLWNGTRLVRPLAVKRSVSSCFNNDQITSSTRLLFSDRDNKGSSS